MGAPGAGRDRGVAPPGADRRPDGPREPAPAADRSRAGHRRGHRSLPRGARDVRPRWVQGLQRHPRASGRRRPASPAGHAARGDVHGVGHRLPPGRGRVLRAPARLAGRARGRHRPGARGADRPARGDPLVVRIRASAARGPRRLLGAADRRPAHVRAEGRPPRLHQAAGARPPARRGRPARSRPAPALRLGGRPRPGGGRAARRRARGDRRPRARRRPARRRQGGHPPLDPAQARPARQGGVGHHPPAHAHRRGDPERGPRARRRGGHRALHPRARRRRRLSRRPGRRRDPARRAHHRRLRRLRRDDERPLLPRRHDAGGGDPRARRLRPAPSSTRSSSPPPAPCSSTPRPTARQGSAGPRRGRPTCRPWPASRGWST